MGRKQDGRFDDILFIYTYMHISKHTIYIYVHGGNVRDTVDASEVLAKSRNKSPNHRVGINYLPSTEEKSEPFYNRG